MVVTCLGDLIETGREHLRSQGHIDLIVVSLDDSCRLALFDARTADGTFTFVSRAEGILHK